MFERVNNVAIEWEDQCYQLQCLEGLGSPHLHLRRKLLQLFIFFIRMISDTDLTFYFSKARQPFLTIQSHDYYIQLLIKFNKPFVLFPGFLLHHNQFLVSRTILVLAGETVSSDFGNQTLQFRLEKSNLAEKGRFGCTISLLAKKSNSSVEMS